MHLLISMFRYRAHIDTPPTSFCVWGGGDGGHGSNGNSQKQINVVKIPKIADPPPPGKHNPPLDPTPPPLNLAVHRA